MRAAIYILFGYVVCESPSLPSSDKIRMVQTVQFRKANKFLEKEGKGQEKGGKGQEKEGKKERS